MCRVDVVIPIVERHDRFLPGLFRDLESDIPVLGKVIVARSELDEFELNSYSNWVQALAEGSGLFGKIVISSVESAAREAPNRNRGWNLATSDFTAFMDADDSYVHGRLTLLESLAVKLNADLIIHGYVSDSSKLTSVSSELFQSKQVKAVRSHQLRFHAFEQDSTLEDLSEDISGLNRNLIIPSDSDRTEVHHAHTFVRTSLREKYEFRDIYPGSDRVFCQEILRDSSSVYYIPLALSSWNIGHSAYSSHENTFLRALKRIKFRLMSRFK